VSVKPSILSNPVKHLNHLFKKPKTWKRYAKTWTPLMKAPFSKLKRISSLKKILKEQKGNTIVDQRSKLMLRTIIFYPLKLSASNLSESTEDTQRSVTGVRRQRLHQLSGNGIHLEKSGIGGMTTNGTTGDHPREDSPQSDGPGIRDSGITTAGSSSTLEVTGTDSKVENGSDTVDKFQSSQRFQSVQKSVDLSIS